MVACLCADISPLGRVYFVIKSLVSPRTVDTSLRPCTPKNKTVETHYSLGQRSRYAVHLVPLTPLVFLLYPFHLSRPNTPLNYQDPGPSPCSSVQDPLNSDNCQNCMVLFIFPLISSFLSAFYLLVHLFMPFLVRNFLKCLVIPVVQTYVGMKHSKGI